MMWLATKYLVTAGIIVLISEVAKRSGKVGALITALPLVAVLAMLWMFVERQPAQQIANYAFYTFWYVLPTLPMFLVLPFLLPRWGFGGALLASIAVTLAGYWLLGKLLRPLGIHLW